MASKKAGQTSPDNREPMATTPRIELVSLDKLKPYENNARTHSPEQVDKLRASLREFGFVNRKCYMMELDEKYCDVIISRWEKMTGQAAVEVDIHG